MTTIKIGVLGCANIAQRAVIPAIKNNINFQLIAVASRDIQKATTFASMYDCEAIDGYQNLLDRDDIDIVYIPLPTGLHEEWVLKSLKAGKHIYIEKSAAVDFQSATKMVNFARQKNLMIIENFMFLYHKQHIFVKELINRGEIGTIRCFRSSFGFPPLSSNNFRYHKKLGGGALLDAGAYTVRASQLFLGKDIWAEASTLSYLDSSVDIYGGAYLKAGTGIFAEIAFGFDNFYQCNYEIWGSEGKITAQKAFTPGPDYKPRIVLEKQDNIINYDIEPDNHFVNILTEVKRCLLENDYEKHYKALLNQSRLLDEIRKKS